LTVKLVELLTLPPLVAVDPGAREAGHQGLDTGRSDLECSDQGERESGAVGISGLAVDSIHGSFSWENVRTGSHQKRWLVVSFLRHGPLANWLSQPRMHADYYLNWGWGKATTRLHRSDEIFSLSIMGYKKFLSGAKWPESARPTGLSGVVDLGAVLPRDR
jgi:hypothetical protein